MQVVLVYLKLFRRDLLLNCVLQPKIHPFTAEVCAAAENCRKITKTPILGVQSRSRSLMLNR